MNRLVPTRWSHLLGYSGVGAIVRADNDLFVIKDIRHWTDRNGAPAGEVIGYVDCIRTTLGIEQKLRLPPSARELPNGAIDGTCVPAHRFPGWMRCPRCGLLHWKPWLSEHDHASPGEGKFGSPRCWKCGNHPRLQQVDWVVAHPEGGLWDVDWHFLTHFATPQRLRDCRWDRKDPAPYLRLIRDPADPQRWLLTCKRCEENGHKVVAPFDRWQPLPPARYPRQQPWDGLGEKTRVESKQAAQILEVNDSRLYYPTVRSALVIPPESRVRRGSILDLLYTNRALRDRLKQTRSDLGRRSLIGSLVDQYRCREEEIADALEKIQKGCPEATRGGLLAKEFRALTEVIPDLADGEDFVPRHRTLGWRALGGTLGRVKPALLAAVSRLVTLTRLREVRVFTGFSRIAQNFEDGLRPTTTPESPDNEPKAGLVPPDLDGSQEWLPAIELYGEGIFFTLDETMLRRWAEQAGIKQRTATLQARFERTRMRFPDTPILPLVPRFILLHTLAHLLIRQLETQAGYPAASIRERIYCNEGEPAMAGILVYVAVPDIVGSLGGLAELAEPNRFLPLLASVFDHADWCSLDPVCSEHEGQGPSQLNLAACHACALVPEPSCQFGNVLLDRTFVRGDLQGAVRPLLDFAATGE